MGSKNGWLARSRQAPIWIWKLYVHDQWSSLCGCPAARLMQAYSVVPGLCL